MDVPAEPAWGERHLPYVVEWKALWASVFASDLPLHYVWKLGLSQYWAFTGSSAQDRERSGSRSLQFFSGCFSCFFEMIWVFPIFCNSFCSDDRGLWMGALLGSPQTCGGIWSVSSALQELEGTTGLKRSRRHVKGDITSSGTDPSSKINLVPKSSRRHWSL